jgi:hypothetical protein
VSGPIPHFCTFDKRSFSHQKGLFAEAHDDQRLATERSGLTLWKKDKTKKGTKETLTEEELIAEGRTLLIKARVDLDDRHANFWTLIDFLRTFKDIDLPEHEFRVASEEDVELAAALEGHDKDAVLSAVKTSREWGVTGTMTAAVGPITVTGLTTTKTYTCTVNATNARGTGLASAPSAAVTA